MRRRAGGRPGGETLRRRTRGIVYETALPKGLHRWIEVQYMPASTQRIAMANVRAREERAGVVVADEEPIDERAHLSVLQPRERARHRRRRRERPQAHQRSNQRVERLAERDRERTYTPRTSGSEEREREGE